MGFWEVTLSLLKGLEQTGLIFALTLVLALPLGLVISFGSMSKFKPLAFVTKVFVWIIRGVPLMLQVIIVFYVPGFLLGTPRIIHTNVFTTYARGLNFDIEPNAITKPKGSANTSVSANIRQVYSRPSTSLRVTSQNPIIFSFIM